MITRHDFLALAGTTLAGLALAACGGGQDDGATAEVSEVAEDTQQEAGTPAEAASLVVYFSQTSGNYETGPVEVGNTAIIAQMIAERTGADLFEIVPAEPYPADSDELSALAQKEQDEGARPAYVSDVDVSAYTDVYVGYPIWLGDLPMCVYTFLEAHDWAGHTVHPFCTHEGSGLADTPDKIASTCAGADVTEGLAVLGTTAQNSRDEAAAEVDAWLGA